MASPVVVIESDDWGPGPPSYARAFEKLVSTIHKHRDLTGRSAVLTAYVILSSADTSVIKKSSFQKYERTPIDESAPDMVNALTKGASSGLVVPQIHALEHFNSEVLMDLARTGNEKVRKLLCSDNFFSWEDLPPNLQRHFLDRYGSSSELPRISHSALVAQATDIFHRVFGQASLSTIAPCCFWTEETEAAWHEHGIRYIQTEGYQLVGGRGTTSTRPRKVIRFGSPNKFNQVYLIRNVIYEPDRGRTVNTCWKQVVHALRQRLPVIIGTHRSNYVGNSSFANSSLKGLDELLTRIDRQYPDRHYMASPELGRLLETGSLSANGSTEGRSTPITIAVNSLPTKLQGFLWRIWYRHKKIRILAIASGLIVPALALACMLGVVSRLAMWRGAAST